MSGDAWSNMIGTAATATTPTGSLTRYSLAADVGTAVWPDQSTFNAWAVDEVRRTRRQDIARVEAAKEQAESSWFNKGMGALMTGGAAIVGAWSNPGKYMDEFRFGGGDEQTQRINTLAGRGADTLSAIGDLPVVKQLATGYDNFYQGLATPFYASTIGFRNDDPWWFASGDAWSQAWQLAEDRSPGRAVVDWVLTGSDPNRSQRDLDRLARTNSLYGVVAFATDLGLSWKLDPTVIAGKGVGEARRIRAGELPYGTGRHVSEAIRGARGQRYQGMNLAGHYGNWRGRRFAENMDEVFEASQTMPFGDFALMPMFRSGSDGVGRVNVTSGPAMALAIKMAARDPYLTDLTKRAVLADPKAWAEIKAMKEGNAPLIPGGRTYLDAIDAQRGANKKLDDELADLETLIAKREVGPNGRTGYGRWYYETYTKELHATYEKKLLDLEDLSRHLEQYEDYKTWLDAIPSPDAPGGLLSAAKVRPAPNLFLKQRTYHNNLFGPAHTVYRMSDAVWMKQANVMDLHRVESGVESLRRQFYQFDHLFQYRVPREVFDDLIERYTRLGATGINTREMAALAREVEGTHLVNAAAQKFNLDPETVREFLNQTRFRQNEMVNALLSGDGAVYTTVPGQSATLKAKLPDGSWKVEMTDGARRYTVTVPGDVASALVDGAKLAQDPVQTPNFYTPMNAREVMLAIRRNPELFTELDSATRLRGRKVSAATMELVIKAGTGWNRIWKPLQLLRLAWPQRVLMDETLRNLAMLGVSGWMSSHVPAYRDAALNLITSPVRGRNKIKIGPGPVADEVTGRSPLVTKVGDDIPLVPDRFESRVTAERARRTRELVDQETRARQLRLRRDALMREPNPIHSLAQPSRFAPQKAADWLEIDALLDATPSRGFPAKYAGPDVSMLDNFEGASFSDADLMVLRTLWVGRVETGLGDRLVNIANRWIEDHDHPITLFDFDMGFQALMGGSHRTRAGRIESEDSWFGPGGSLRPLLDDLIPHAREMFEEYVRTLSSGKDFHPLFPQGGMNGRNSINVLNPEDYWDLLVARARGARYVPLDYHNAEFYRAHASNGRADRLLSRQVPEVPFEGKFWDAFSDFTSTSVRDMYHMDGQRHTPKRQSARLVADPLNGKVSKSGYAVPVRTRSNMHDPVFKHAPDYRNDVAAFMIENADLLSAGNHRLMVTGRFAGEGRDLSKFVMDVSVVRLFNTKQVRDAAEFAHHVGADRFFNVADDLDEYVLEHGQTNRFTEALHRQFAYGPTDPEFRPGSVDVVDDPDAPLGVRNVEVYHGTISALPKDAAGNADLLPRDDPGVPVANGRMIGDGFYTSTDLDEVQLAYGTGYTGETDVESIYTIRGTKSGKTYKIFNLDQAPTPEQRADLIAGFDRWAAKARQDLTDHLNGEPDPTARADAIEYWHREFDAAYGRLRDRLEAAENDTYNGAYTWSQIMAGSTEFYSPLRQGIYPRRFITEYLIDKFDAGALTHVGGTRGTVNGGGRHQVYVWLFPEDMVIRPAWDSNGDFEMIEEYFANPANREVAAWEQSWDFPNEPHQPGRVVNPVPENRIHRVGPTPRQKSRIANGQLHALERAVLDGDDLDLEFNLHIDSPHERMLQRIFRKRQYASSSKTFRAPGGKKIVVPGAFEGAGEIYVPLVSGAPVYARMSDAYRTTLSMGRARAVGYKRLMPPDMAEATLKSKAGWNNAVEYYTMWADLLNDQIRNSKIWFQMLDGKTDDEILDWLESTAAGARLRKELPHKGHDPARWVEEHRQALDFYVPDTRLQKLLRERKLKPSDLTKVNREDLPEVYGPDLELIEGGTALGRAWSRWVEKAFTTLGTKPTDALSRQPLFRGMYDLKMKNLIAAADPEDLTDEVIQAYAKLSREFALAQVKRTLYDLGDDTNMTEALRFMAPFWGAQSEAITKWTRIIVEKPETLARFYLGTGLAYDRLTVRDEDNKPVNRPSGAWGPFGYNPNDRLVFQVPKTLTEMQPFKTLLAGQTGLGVAFGSLNTALQGDQPHLPALGPVLSLPAHVLMNAFWETHGTELDDNFFYRWLFPVGRPKGGIEGALEFLFPGWGRRLSQLRAGEDSRTYLNTFFSVQREMEAEARRTGGPMPTADEVKAATNWHFALRVITGFAAPVALEFRPKHQFYLDESHRLTQKYGPNEGFERFVQKYGVDAAKYAASSSESVGIPPTAQGMREGVANDANRALIQRLVETGHQDLVSAVISPDAWADDFSSDSYGAQFEINLGPGSTQNLRRMRGAAERDNFVDSRLGWLDYRQFMAAINAELYARGLTSLQQTAAQDLADAKTAFVSELAAKYPAWAQDYQTFENTIYSKVEALRSFAYQRRFDNRPDIQGFRQYLIIRDAAAQSLDDYALATGGSRSLQAEENTDLRNWFYAQVGQLIQDNPAFGEFYTRYLDTDRLERGSG